MSYRWERNNTPQIHTAQKRMIPLDIFRPPPQKKQKTFAEPMGQVSAPPQSVMPPPVEMSESGNDASSSSSIDSIEAAHEAIDKVTSMAPDDPERQSIIDSISRFLSAASSTDMSDEAPALF